MERKVNICAVRLVRHPQQQLRCRFFQLSFAGLLLAGLSTSFDPMHPIGFLHFCYIKQYSCSGCNWYDLDLYEVTNRSAKLMLGSMLLCFWFVWFLASSRFAASVLGCFMFGASIELGSQLYLHYGLLLAAVEVRAVILHSSQLIWRIFCAFSKSCIGLL